jgi:hypothetical protein
VSKTIPAHKIPVFAGKTRDDPSFLVFCHLNHTWADFRKKFNVKQAWFLSEKN